MHLLFTELPVLYDSSQSGSSLLPDVPPVELLSLAESARNRGATIETFPAPEDEIHLASDSGAIPFRAKEVAKVKADAIVLAANVYQWPAASELARCLAELGFEKDQVILLGPLPQSVQQNREDFVLASESRYGEVLGGWQEQPPFPLRQILDWPRRTRAISLGETFGFPLDAQLHPWNAPETQSWTIDSADELIRQLATVASERHELLLGMRRPPFGWTREGLDFLGSLALRALEDHHALVRYHVRISVQELLRPGILESLGLLELERIEVLADLDTDSSPRPMEMSRDTTAIEQAASEIARAGLSTLTRLSFVLGLPHETPDQVLSEVQFAVRLTLMAGIPNLRFEWWTNAPGSVSAGPSGQWESLLRESSSSLFSGDDYRKAGSDLLNPGCRQGIEETIEILSLAQGLEITGPDLLVPSYVHP